MIPRLRQWALTRLGFWLFHANRYPGQGKAKELFYDLKETLLNRYGVADGHDVQILPAKICYTCKGTGVDQNNDYEEENEDCPECCGTGIYLPRAYVILVRFRLGRFVFHRPEGRDREEQIPQPFKSLLQAQTPIMGILKKQKTRFSHEARLWLFLLFRRDHFGLIVAEIHGWGTRPNGLLATPVFVYKRIRWTCLRLYHFLLNRVIYRSSSPTFYVPPLFQINPLRWRWLKDILVKPKPLIVEEPTDDLPF